MSRLVLLVLISLLPALGIIVYSGLDRSSREIEDAKSDALEAVKSLAYEHERVNVRSPFSRVSAHRNLRRLKMRMKVKELRIKS
jgi:archaellum component FlaF (FlaF/FlaG flagellin family)